MPARTIGGQHPFEHSPDELAQSIRRRHISGVLRKRNIFLPTALRVAHCCDVKFPFPPKVVVLDSSEICPRRRADVSHTRRFITLFGKYGSSRINQALSSVICHFRLRSKLRFKRLYETIVCLIRQESTGI
jgi:hypothetical protein